MYALPIIWFLYLWLQSVTAPFLSVLCPSSQPQTSATIKVNTHGSHISNGFYLVFVPHLLGGGKWENNWVTALYSWDINRIISNVISWEKRIFDSEAFKFTMNKQTDGYRCRSWCVQEEERRTCCLPQPLLVVCFMDAPGGRLAIDNWTTVQLYMHIICTFPHTCMYMLIVTNLSQREASLFYWFLVILMSSQAT